MSILGIRDSGTKIITNGLVFWLDAGQLRSYPGSGTTWVDLSGNNNNVTLTNGPTYSSTNGGIISFDGSNDYANFFAPNLGTTTTVEMWAKLINPNGGMLFGWYAYDVYTYLGFGFNTANGGDIYGISSATVTSLGLNGNWRHYVFEMRSDVSYTNNKMYINNSQQSLSQIRSSESSVNRNFNSGNGRISGWRVGDGYHQQMDLSAFRVYNRALTVTEISQNYNADRARFGL